MSATRLLALATWLAAAGVQAETVVRLQPDQRLSAGLPPDARLPSISNDGRFVALETDHPQFDFARVSWVLDRQDLATPQRVGSDCNFFAPDCETERPRISGNGRYVIFDTRMSYGPGDDEFQNDRDVFVWDRVAQTTTRVSLGAGGVEPNGESYAGDISFDGRYVAFTSYATNLPGSPPYGGSGISRSFWKDRQNDIVKPVRDPAAPLSTSYPGVRLTSNGRYALAFRADSNPTHAINWDALNASVGPQVFNYWISDFTMAMTPDRRFTAGTSVPTFDGSVAYVTRQNGANSAIEVSGEFGVPRGVDLSVGSNWLAVDNCAPPSFPNAARTIAFHARGPRTFRVALARPGCEPLAGFDLSADGRYAVFVAGDLNVAGPDPFDDDTDADLDVFLVENRLWTPPPTNLVAQFTSVPADSRNVKVSSDGRIGVFESEIPASEFGAWSDANGAPDIFRYLADFQQIELLSTVDGSSAWPGGARNPAMSADGETVAFEAPDPGTGIANLGSDGKSTAPVAYKAGTIAIFLRRLVQNQLQRASVSRTGTAPNGNSMNPALSPDGRRAAFATDASNVNPGSDPNAHRDVVAVDLQSGVRQCVSTCGVSADGDSDRPALSNEGSVVFESSAGALQKAAGADKATGFAQILLRSLLNGSSQVVSRNAAGQSGNGASTRPAISNNGRVVAYQSGASNLDASGSDGRVNVIRTAIGGASQRISRSGGSIGKSPKAADGDSVRPALSGDGRFLAFQSDATTLAGLDENGVTDLLVHDARDGSLRRLSEGYGGMEANGASETPHLDYNGTRVGFHSFASNLDAAGEPGASNATSAPYEARNPAALGIVFADAFE